MLDFQFYVDAGLPFDNLSGFNSQQQAPFLNKYFYVWHNKRIYALDSAFASYELPFLAIDNWYYRSAFMDTFMCVYDGSVLLPYTYNYSKSIDGKTFSETGSLSFDVPPSFSLGLSLFYRISNTLYMQNGTDLWTSNDGVNFTHVSVAIDPLPIEEGLLRFIGTSNGEAIFSFQYDEDAVLYLLRTSDGISYDAIETSGTPVENTPLYRVYFFNDVFYAYQMDTESLETDNILYSSSDGVAFQEEANPFFPSWRNNAGLFFFDSVVYAGFGSDFSESYTDVYTSGAVPPPSVEVIDAPFIGGVNFNGGAIGFSGATLSLPGTLNNFEAQAYPAGLGPNGAHDFTLIQDL